MKEIIQSIIALSEEQYDLFVNSGTSRVVPRNHLIFTANRVNQKILFLNSGILRSYRLVDGKDLTHHFHFPGWFATDYASFLTGATSTLFFQALTEVRYWEFDKNNLETLYGRHAQFEKLGRIIAERAFLLTNRKFSDIQSLDLKQRYVKLLEQSPELFLQVPQKYIASYLGVSEQSLSRIKKSLIS